MSELRHSIWGMMIAQLRPEIADSGDLEKWSDPLLQAELVKATMKLPNVGSAVMNNMVPFNFQPASDGGIDDTLYENYSNIVTQYYLAQSDDTLAAACEIKAYTFPGKQVILVVPYFQFETGTGDAPVLDISLNKDPSDGENLRGTFLYADGRIDALESGKAIDTSMIPSASFSFKWTFAANSKYKIRETLFEIMTADMVRLRDEMSNIVLMAAANIYQQKITEVTNKGIGGQFVESLQRRYDTLVAELRGNIGTGVSLTAKVDGIEGIDRGYFANKAFGNRSTGMDGQWVEIITNQTGSRVIRVIPDD